MTASPVHSRAFVTSKRRRPAPLYLDDEDDSASNGSGSGGSSARRTPVTRSTPRRYKGRPTASPAAGKASSQPSSRSRCHVHNLRSSGAVTPHDKPTDKWAEQSLTSEKDESGDDGQLSGSGMELGGGRRLGLQINIGNEDGEMVRAHSSPPSLLNSLISHAYRAALRDSDDDSPINTLKRQRTANASPSHAATPPCSPIASLTTHSFHCSYPVQPSPSPMLRQLSLETDSPPAMGECVSTTVSVTSSTMYFSRPLSLIIEEAEDIIVPVPHTATPYPSPASPVASPRRSREGRLLSLPYAGVTMRRGVRKTQQDAFVARGEREPLRQQSTSADECALPESFFAVMDGHGVEGGEVSTETSSWLPTYFFSSLAAATEPSSPSSTSSSVSSVEPSSSNSSAVSAAFESSFAMADQLICEEQGFRGGTTACCAYLSYQPHRSTTATSTHLSHTDSPASYNSSPLPVRPSSAVHNPPHTGLTLHLASVGDSRAILFSANQPPRLLTVDHSTTNTAEQARITAAGGHLLFSHCSLRVNGVLNVTRSIGDRALKQFVISQPQQSEVEIMDGDEVLMLITDGVSNALSMDDLQAAVVQCADKPGELSEYVIDLALKRRSKDNVTAVCIHIPTYLTHIRKAHNDSLDGDKQHPTVLTITDPTQSTHVCTPPPSRERRDGTLPPVPPFTCSPTPSSPSPATSPSLSVTDETTPSMCVRSAERTSGGVWRGSKTPLLTSRSRLSTSFFAMLPDSRDGVKDEDEDEDGGEADMSMVLNETTETGVVLC